MGSMVSFNQTGYVGMSMSVNASLAYEDDEMPKSKWTKGVMTSALMDWCDKNDGQYSAEVEEMTKEEIFRHFFEWKSWHHTGKFANQTDFYGIDEDVAHDYFCELTEDEIAERVTKLEVYWEEKQKRSEKYQEARRRKKAKLREAREKAEEEYFNTHGYPYNSLKALMNAYPEACVVSTNEKGKVVVGYIDGIFGYSTERLKDADKMRVYKFDGLNHEAYRSIIEKKSAEIQKAKRKAEKIEKQRMVKRRKEERFLKKYGYPHNSVKALMNAYPEACRTRPGSKKEIVVEFPTHNGKVGIVKMKNIEKVSVSGFDGLHPEEYRAAVDKYLALYKNELSERKIV